MSTFAVVYFFFDVWIAWRLLGGCVCATDVEVLAETLGDYCCCHLFLCPHCRKQLEVIQDQFFLLCRDPTFAGSNVPRVGSRTFSNKTPGNRHMIF